MRKTSQENQMCTPSVAMDYVPTGSEQEREEKKGMPTLIAKDTRAKVITAKVEGAVPHAPEVLKRISLVLLRSSPSVCRGRFP